MENGHPDTSEGTSESTDIDPYEKKYFALLRRCENMQQDNERLVNRLNHVKKLLRRLRHERRFLKQRLDKHEDNYRNVPLILPIETGLEDETHLNVMAVPDFSHSGTAAVLSDNLLSATNPTSGPPLPLTSWPSKAESSTSGNQPKKTTRGDKGRGNAKKTLTNTYFQFSQESSIMEGYAPPSKAAYDFYNGEKDMWLFGTNDVISQPLNIDKQSVLMTESPSPIP